MSTLTIYADSGRVSRASFPTSRDPVVDTTSLGVYCQSRQVRVHSHPANQVSRSSSQLGVNGAQSPRGEAETDQWRSRNTPLPITDVNQSTVPIHREAKCCCSDHTPSSPVLPPFEGQPEKRPCLWQLWLQECDTYIPTSSGRIALVAAAPPDMVFTQRPGADNHLRCLLLGMRSNLQWDTDRRSMIRTGEDIAHQLSGNVSSLPGSPVILKRPIRSLGTTAVGQYHCNGLHQQSGRTVSPYQTSLVRSLWLWVLQRDILLTA